MKEMKPKRRFVSFMKCRNEWELRFGYFTYSYTLCTFSYV